MFIQRSDVFAKKTQLYLTQRSETFAMKTYVNNEAIRSLKTTSIRYNGAKLFAEKTDVRTRVKDVALILLLVSKQGESFRRLVT